MIFSGKRQRIHIAKRSSDVRCGHRAPVPVVLTELKLDPHSTMTIIFHSKRGDRLKVLVRDGSGLMTINKIQGLGSLALPKVKDGTMRLLRAQHQSLFEGLDRRQFVGLVAQIRG